jgi:cell division septum initiation protein DivIVA
MIEVYTEKSTIAHARYTAAIDSGEDKIAAEEWAHYQNYNALLKHATTTTS